jgi:hypothetical protein
MLSMKLSTIRTHALALPEVTEEPHFDFSSFRVRGKIFATVPPDEEHLHVFLKEESRIAALEQCCAFAEDLHWGKKILGLRVSLPEADAAAVKKLLDQAWEEKAPKTVAAQWRENRLQS